MYNLCILNPPLPTSKILGSQNTPYTCHWKAMNYIIIYSVLSRLDFYNLYIYIYTYVSLNKTTRFPFWGLCMRICVDLKKIIKQKDNEKKQHKILFFNKNIDIYKTLDLIFMKPGFRYWVSLRYSVLSFELRARPCTSNEQEMLAHVYRTSLTYP